MSATLLRAAGLTDPVWLEAVEQHHEVPGGTWLPGGVRSRATSLRRCAGSTSSWPSTRAVPTASPCPPSGGARPFVSSQGHPVGAMLIKEFGIYPPGCFVKLASGETAVVVRRGAAANTPFAAAVTNKNGDALSDFPRRDTSLQQFAILSTIPDKAVMVRVPSERLYG